MFVLETSAVLDVKARMRLRVLKAGDGENLPVYEFFEFMKTIGKPGDTEIAEALGLPRSVIWKLRNGQRPSSDFMAAVKITFPIISMDRFFEAEVVSK